jgi:hypothetical protein
MQGEGHSAISGFARLMKAPEELYVDVLIKGARQPITRAWKYAPATALVIANGNGVVVGRIAETKKRERLERTIEANGTMRWSATGNSSHTVPATQRILTS